jgi:TM2 domain-containing membrane protein YozV
MSTSHKNKTLATFLALVFGAVGVHRFYLRGSVDRLGLLHVTCLPIAGMVYGLAQDANWFYWVLPVLVSAVAGYIEALVLGTMPDEKFDAAFNQGSGQKSDSSWIVALLLVLTMMAGSVVLIATMSRLFALIATGGYDG